MACPLSTVRAFSRTASLPGHQHKEAHFLRPRVANRRLTSKRHVTRGMPLFCTPTEGKLSMIDALRNHWSRRRSPELGTEPASRTETCRRGRGSFWSHDSTSIVTALWYCRAGRPHSPTIPPVTTCVRALDIGPLGPEYPDVFARYLSSRFGNLRIARISPF